MKGVFLGLIEFIFECDPDPPVTALNAKAFYEAGTPIELIEKATGLSGPEIESILSD